LPHFDISRSSYGDTAIFTLQNNSNIDEISWQFGDPESGSNTSSEMQPKHVFSAPGTYQVQVTEYFNGVEYNTYSNTVEIINYLHILETNDNHALFSIYPNPGDGFINLVFKQDVKEAVISVRNTVGQQVWGPVNIDGLVENEEVGIDLGEIPGGIYFIQINDKNISATSKYVLQR
jgi:PKD repeat protein